MNKVYFQNLDAIRTIAAMMVFNQHVGLGHFIKDTFGFHVPIISNGGFGVSIFFVMSGFLITYLIISEIKLNDTLNLRNFYLRRILRIWPLYYAVILFTFLIYPEIRQSIGLTNDREYNFVYHLFFLSNFDVLNIHQHCAGMDTASQNITWSVSIEEQFYLFWPLIFLIKKNVWIYILTLLLVVSFTFTYSNFGVNGVNYFHTIPCLIDLVVGGIFAFCLWEVKNFKTFFESKGDRFCLGIIILSFLIMIFYSDLTKLLENWSFLVRFFAAISFGLFICIQSISKNMSFLNLKQFKFATYWGKYTYGIYLIHPIIITFFAHFLTLLNIEKDGTLLTRVVFIILTFLATLFVAKFSYIYFESYFLKLKSRYQLIKTYN